MAIETTATQLGEHLTSYLDKVGDDQEIVIIHREGAPDVAMVPATEISGLLETAYLLRSPNNAQRLMTALERAEKGEGEHQTIKELHRELRIE